MYKGAIGYYTDANPARHYVRSRYYLENEARWMSLDPIRSWTPFVDSTNDFCFVLNNPIGNIDPSGLMTVATTRFPNPVICNGEVRVDFTFTFESQIKVTNEMANGAPCNGYLVQLVKVRCYYDDDCPSCIDECDLEAFGKKAITFSYYEATPVLKGAKTVIDTVFWQGAKEKRCGLYHQTGEARFYCQLRADIPKDLKNTSEPTGIIKWPTGVFSGSKTDPTQIECATSVGGWMKRSAKGFKPKFWESDPVEGPTLREYDLKMQCCKDKTKAKLNTVPEPE